MLNYTSIIFVSMYHIIALYGLLNYTLTKFDIFVTLFMYVLGGFGVTMGYHRLWSHKSYKASTILKIILAFAGASASQGSIIWWTKYHRLHHNKSDTEDDPYGPQKGFLYSHILWIFENRNLPKLKDIKIDDLTNDPIVKFQHKYYVLISLLSSIFLPLIIYKFQNLYHCLFFPISLAKVILWHSTWFVNSLAHYLGDQPHGKSGSSKNHLITAFLTFGEGYHNYHHEYPYDYRNGTKWYEYDPTKLLIEFCSLIGLASELKTVDKMYNKFIKKIKESDMTLDEYYKSNRKLIILNSRIYDIEEFLFDHPGGYQYLNSIIRKNPELINEYFYKYNNHTQGALKLLDKFYICDIKSL